MWQIRTEEFIQLERDREKSAKKSAILTCMHRYWNQFFQSLWMQRQIDMRAQNRFQHFSKVEVHSHAIICIHAHLCVYALTKTLKRRRRKKKQSTIKKCAFSACRSVRRLDALCCSSYVDIMSTTKPNQTKTYEMNKNIYVCWSDQCECTALCGRLVML